MRSTSLTLTIATLMIAGSAQGQATGSGNPVPAPGTTVAKPLGLTQDAWNARLRTRGESASHPGYIRYIYNPANVFPIRTRESMITTIKLPADEKLTQAFSGDDQGFQVGIPTPNSIAIKALFPGVDTNVVAYTEEGRVYTFYVRSEGYNSKTISDFLVDVVMPGQGAVDGSTMGVDAPTDAMGKLDGKTPALTAERIRDPYGSAPMIKNERYREYAESTDFNPNTIVEDIGVYVPRGESGGTIPYRVFHDDRFTYVDYGANASQMNEWPTPVIVIQGVEGPVGFRTGGPGGRMLIMEGLGSFVLRNGQRIIVIKPRKDVPISDKVLVEYPTASSGRMAVPSDLPPGRPSKRQTKATTVVAIEGASMTRNGEAPSKLASLPIQPHNGAAKYQREHALAGGVSSAGIGITEIPAPAPASPVRIATAGSADAAMGAALGATTSTGVLRPLSGMQALSGYRVVVGRGTSSEIADRWKSYKVQYYAVLNGRRMEEISNSDGSMSMGIVPVGTVAEGMRICASLSEDTGACSVKPLK